MALTPGGDPFFPEGLPESVATEWPRASLPAPTGRVRQLPPAMAPMPDPLALAKALRHHWLLALVLGTIGATVAGAAAWRLVPSPKYTASALIEVKSVKPILLSDAGQEKTEYKVFQSTQLALVKSRLVLVAALKRPGVADLPAVRSQEEPADWLDDQLTAEFQAGSELMRLTMSGDRPGDLSLLVNAVADAYLDEIFTKDHHDRDADAIRFRTLIEQYNEKLTKQRAELRKLAEDVGSDDRQTLALKQQFALQQLSDARTEQQRVQSETKRLGVKLAVLREAEAEQAPRPLDPSVVEQALANDLTIERYRVMSEDLATKLARTRALVKSDSDPAVRDLRIRQDTIRKARYAREAELRPKVERRLRQQVGDRNAEDRIALETELKFQMEFEKVLAQGIERLEKDAKSFNRQSIDLQSIKDEISAGEDTARLLTSKLEALNVEEKAPQRGKIVQRADNPRKESGRKRMMAIALAALGVFASTVVGVSWREYRLRKVDSPEEVVDGLGLRLVGLLPALPEAKRRDADPGEAARWKNLLVESVDAVRTVLLRECHRDDLRAVMVTSASKGEGKSSLSSHLAISLARTGRRTLLIDFDLRNPSLQRLFDLPTHPGTGELLRGEAEVEEAAVPVMAHLDVIPAGRRDAAAIRALAQEALPLLIARLKAQYDFVVIDSAPVLPVADSLLVGQQVDAVVLSVYREVSRVPTVFAGYERLASLGVRILGVVVTGVHARHFGPAYHAQPALDA